MGVFGLSRLFDSKSHVCSIDSNPTLTFEPSGHLAGWIITKSGIPELILKLDQEVIFHFTCQIPRPDVVAKIKTQITNLVCGFQLDIPIQILEHLKADSLKLFLKGEKEDVELWTWNGEGVISSDESAKIAVRGFFEQKSRKNIELQTARMTSSNKPDLHVIVEFWQNYPALKRLSFVLGKWLNNKTSASLKSITVCIDEKDDFAELETNFLDKACFKGVKFLYKTKNDFPKFSDLFEEIKATNDSLLLFVDSRADCSYLDFEAYINSYRSIPLVSVLMPTIYGGPSNIHGPELVMLKDLRESSSIQGQDIPALYPIKTTGPVWLSSIQIVRMMEGEIETAIVEGKRREFGIHLPANRYSYYIDLRQAIVMTQPTKFDYSHEFGALLQHSIDLEIKWVPARSKNKKEAIFILGEDWLAHASGFGWQFQIIALANEIQEQGYDVKFVIDTAEERFCYVNGFPAMSLGKFFAHNAIYSDGVVIVSSPLAMCAAQTIRYVFDYEVLFLIQDELLPERYLKQPDKFEKVVRAYKGNYLPLLVSAGSCRKLENLCDGLEEAITIEPRYNSDVFGSLKLSRHNKGVVAIFRGNGTTELQRKLSQAITTVKEKVGHIELSLVNTEATKSWQKELLEQARSVIVSPNAEALASLFAENRIVLDFLPTGFSPIALESCFSGAPLQEG